ncbi:MAG: type II toxin-antitoxin system HicA family toxin [Dehalococcoidia bacterium]|nr:type II toxin-antitoxin system HicA family toxin [Dehalococcoidia bacterium]
MDDLQEQSSALSSRDRRLLRTILSGRSDANIRFAELRRLLHSMGFDERVRGSHHIFTIEGIRRPLSIQPLNSIVKPYQVRQFRAFVIQNGLVPHDS